MDQCFERLSWIAMAGIDSKHVTIKERGNSSSRSPPGERASSAVPDARMQATEAMEELPTSGSSGQTAGEPSPNDYLATSRMELLSPLTTGEVSRQTRPKGTQRAKFPRSAAGKARPRSSSPAPAATQCDARVRADSAPSRPTPPPIAASLSATVGSAEELVLLRLAGLTTRSTANKAWQSIARSLPEGPPTWIEVVTLAVHDYVTLVFRDRDAADMAYQALFCGSLVHALRSSRRLAAWGSPLPVL